MREWEEVQEHHHAWAVQYCVAVSECSQLRMTQRLSEETQICCCVVKPSVGEVMVVQPRGTTLSAGTF